MQGASRRPRAWCLGSQCYVCPGLHALGCEWKCMYMEGTWVAITMWQGSDLSPPQVVVPGNPKAKERRLPRVEAQGS